MAKKKILSVGCELASDEIEYCDFDSDISLLDWDIILFKPDIDDITRYCNGTYKGKPSLNDDSSFQLKERSEHWRREIKDSVDSGKTIIVFLPDLEEVYIDTGEREYSGTGRNQKTTRIVDSYDNYRCIPVRPKPIKTKGVGIKLASRGAEFISPYWKNFEKYSQYCVVLSGDNIPACLLTKNGDKPVGAIYRSEISAGALVLVPNIDFYNGDFVADENNEQIIWTKNAEVFASQMVSTIVSLDKTLKSEGELTPEPDWSRASEYELVEEAKIRSSLLRTEAKLEKLQTEKESLQESLREAGRLRNLLFEKGKPLEFAIIDALKALGFAATQYHDAESEFDVVFESKEGRMIGEAEGKDSKAINIDKLRQLEMNIHEDLERDDVEVPAKSVLFSNAYRLTPVNDRKESFTKKCVSAALRSSTALVSTTDLFKVAQYLSNKRNARFAARCRKAIINSVGLVAFPDIPNIEVNKPTDHSEDLTRTAR